MVGTDADFATFEARVKANALKFRACGIGQTDNNGTVPKGVMCTDVNLVGEKCEETDATVDNTVCLRWEDRDNNL